MIQTLASSSSGNNVSTIDEEVVNKLITLLRDRLAVPLITKDKTSNHDLQDELVIPNWLQIIATLGEICMVVNASVNYVVYHYLN